MFVSLSDLHVEVQPQCDDMWRRGLGKVTGFRLGHEGGTL